MFFLQECYSREVEIYLENNKSELFESYLLGYIFLTWYLQLY